MIVPWSQNSGSAAEIAGEPSLASALELLSKRETLACDDELFLSGDWLQGLLDQIPDYIFVKDRQRRFVMANDQVAFDIGAPDRSFLIGKTDLDLHPQEIGLQFMAVEAEIIASKAPKLDFVELLLTPDGKRKWFSSSKFPVLTAGNEVVGIVGICRDITERKMAELLQNGQNKVLQEIANGQPLRDVLTTLVLTIEDQLDGVVGSVMLVDDAGTNLTAAAGPHLPDEYVEMTDGIPIGPQVGSCGTAVFRQENVFVENILESNLWAAFQEGLRHFDMRSCWSFPFFDKEGKVLGTFGLYTAEHRAPCKHEHQLATEAARLASIAVERDRSEGKIRYLAHHDPLTGLPNRQKFKEQLEEKIAGSRVTGVTVAVVFVDLDNFKTVNDSFGHDIGDKVLKIIAERIFPAGQNLFEVIRFGGDEFVLVVEGEGAEKQALMAFMERLSREITRTIQIGDLSFHVTSSIGAACFPHDAQDAEELLRNADKAMFEAKSSGRDSCRIFEPCRPQKSLNKLTLLEEMRSGIARGEFFLEYQPQFNLTSGRIVGAEALVRWQHPTLERLMPGDFIKLAEESGLIVPLGRWVVNEACRQNRVWQSQGLAHITMGVNVSARQFRDAGLVGDVRTALEACGLAAQYLELEVTETLLIENGEQAVGVMEEFRQLGVKLAIDDFGTGYSSLAALKSFPLTRLKIDKSFIKDLELGDSDRCIARAIISLGRELGLNVVAEGVETAKQQAFLASCQCETVQGFHFGRPMSAEKFGKLLGMTLVRLEGNFERANI